MNTLSWLIYAAEVLGSVQVIVGVTAGVAGFIIFATALFTAIEDENAERAGPFLRKYAWLPVALAILAAALPSSRTVYLIAASEAGEQVVSSPDAIEMMGDLKAIIKKRLKDELGGDK